MLNSTETQIAPENQEAHNPDMFQALDDIDTGRAIMKGALLGAALWALGAILVCVIWVLAKRHNW